MIQEIDRHLTQQPRAMVVLGLMLGLLIALPGVLVMAGVCFPIVWLCRRWLWEILLFALLVTLIMYGIDGITPAAVWIQNTRLTVAYWHGHEREVPYFFLALVSLPAGLGLSVVLVAVLHRKRGHRAELRRVERGVFHQPRRLTDTQLSTALSTLTSSTAQDGAILGVDLQRGQPIVLTDAQANLHTLVIGTTGSGKTTTVCNMIESAIDRQYPVIYVDGKGDRPLAEQVKRYAEHKGRPFYLFSMLGESVRYNPLACGGITSKKDRIVELRTWSEDHYRKIAEGYLQTVFSVLAQCDQAVDLSTLAQYLSPDALYELARRAQCPAAFTQIETLEDKEKEITSLIAEIQTMAHSEIGDLFNCQQASSGHRILTLPTALAEQAVVYFCLQPLAFPAYATTLGKLIINDLKALAASQLDQVPKKTLYALFDEFSVFAGDQIIYLINQGRSAGIHAVLSTQSLSDISRQGDALLGQVLSNCNNYIIQRQNYHEDAEQLANMIGTSDQFQITSQVDVRQSRTGMGSVRQAKAFIVHPDQIKRLKQGEGIVVNKQGFQVRYARFRQGLCLKK